MKKYVAIVIFILLFICFESRVCAEDTALVPIMGQGTLTAEQMYKYLITNNKKDGANPIDENYAREFVINTIKEAETEGVRSDVAFALMMHETGFLNFGGDVIATQNNFGGLGATGGGVQGAAFADMQLGIRGVVQHLKCYASTDALVNECIDPRFSESIRGKAIYVQWLGVADNPNGTGWASPGNGYGDRILSMISEIAAVDASDVPAISLAAAAEETPEETPAETSNSLFNLSSGDMINFVIAVFCFILLLIVLKKLFFGDKKKGKKAYPRNRRYY